MSILSTISSIKEVKAAVIGDVAGVLLDASSTATDAETVAAVMGFMVSSISQAGDFLGLGPTERISIAGKSSMCVVTIHDDSVVTVYADPSKSVAGLEKKLDAALDR